MPKTSTIKTSSALLAAALLLSSTVWAQIYKTTDAEGNVVYTDQPQAGQSTEQVQLQRTNRTPPPPVMPAVTAGKEDPESEEAEETVVTIVSPKPETTIPMGPGNFSVTAKVTPALGRGQSLQLSIDGEPQGQPQASGFWDLTNIFRGAHDLTVAVLNQEGETVSQSDPVRVYVMRPSVN